MAGRDPHEAHRAATPLELLFDLTFGQNRQLRSMRLLRGKSFGLPIPFIR